MISKIKKENLYWAKINYFLYNLIEKYILFIKALLINRFNFLLILIPYRKNYKYYKS